MVRSATVEQILNSYYIHESHYMCLWTQGLFLCQAHTCKVFDSIWYDCYTIVYAKHFHRKTDTQTSVSKMPLWLWLPLYLGEMKKITKWTFPSSTYMHNCYNFPAGRGIEPWCSGLSLTHRRRVRWRRRAGKKETEEDRRGALRLWYLWKNFPKEQLIASPQIRAHRSVTHAWPALVMWYFL